ncbi:MAG: 16S rRNA (cytosine(1402)-N(4))-methyltransferase [Desulfuromonas sp.]|nr:MAG: 16S rRNA (cytosine(1402)-N(4))-methyltransferase [Desulfuromonas sp.]
MGVSFSHLSVMPREVLNLLAPASGELFIDGTVGGGGHSRLILEAMGADGALIAFDRDPAALKRAGEVLAPYGERVQLVHRNFSEAADVLNEMEVDGVDGILLDLGVSSHQLDTPERGFSFRVDAPLDMRMDPTRGETAAQLLESLEWRELARIFKEYGEERWAGKIARAIVRCREQQQPLKTTLELAELVRHTVPGGMVPGRIHPATRVFQALRIEVNGELDHVAQGVEQAIRLLKPGGRLAVIAFHSLEDRIVKRIFVAQARRCLCPPELPICVCKHTPAVELLTRKAVKANETEIANNPRARSAILRAVRRLPAA